MITDCLDCAEKYSLPADCCLEDCGENEVCRSCDKGMYLNKLTNNGGIV